MTVLVDTNILLDVIQQRQPHHADAARLWALVEQGALDAYVSAISFNNIFYIVRKQGGRDVALDSVKVVRKLFQFVPLDQAVIDRAIALPLADFEDAIQLTAAEQIRADYIVSRNVKHFAGQAVACVTAGTLLSTLQP